MHWAVGRFTSFFGRHLVSRYLHERGAPTIDPPKRISHRLLQLSAKICILTDGRTDRARGCSAGVGGLELRSPRCPGGPAHPDGSLVKNNDARESRVWEKCGLSLENLEHTGASQKPKCLLSKQYVASGSIVVSYVIMPQN